MNDLIRFVCFVMEYVRNCVKVGQCGADGSPGERFSKVRRFLSDHHNFLGNTLFINQSSVSLQNAFGVTLILLKTANDAPIRDVVPSYNLMIKHAVNNLSRHVLS